MSIVANVESSLETHSAVSSDQWFLHFRTWVVSAIFAKKTPKRMWLCAGISPIWYALQTQ